MSRTQEAAVHKWLVRRSSQKCAPSRDLWCKPTTTIELGARSTCIRQCVACIHTYFALGTWLSFDMVGLEICKRCPWRRRWGLVRPVLDHTRAIETVIKVLSTNFLMSVLFTHFKLLQLSRTKPTARIGPWSLLLIASYQQMPCT